MLNLFNKNGLVFWSEKDILTRERVVSQFIEQITNDLHNLNNAFKVIRCESTILTPKDLINQQYTDQDVFAIEDLVLRPETTKGSYKYAEHLLHTNKLPLCVYQSGKSFRNEQDKVTKHVRLKEFYQLEFQIIYSNTTQNDYSKTIIPNILNLFNKILSYYGSCEIENSEILPYYSLQTTDIVFKNHQNYSLELCSISKRNDFENAQVLEVAIGLDRIIYIMNYFIKENK